MTKPLWQYSACELQEPLTKGTVSPIDLLETVLGRIEQLNPTLNAVIAVDKQARRYAEDSTRRLKAGQARSPLEGIPVAVKDNLLVKGLTATWGSKLFADYVPDHDELPVERLRAAGAVIIGKTNVPEFTVEGYTSNLLFGTTCNPWDTALTPGGSSGGAVAAVAAGMVPLAIGTDGGGSIRRPACHTGLVGFKPSTGRIPRRHGFPQILLDFEVVGPLTRRVADAALLFEAMAGPDRRDRKSLLATVSKVPEGDLRPLRICYVPRFNDAPVDPEVAASVDAAARQLQALGHELEQAELPFDPAVINEFWPIFGQVAVAYLLERYPQTSDLVGPHLLTVAQAGANCSAAHYLGLIEEIDRFRGIVSEAFTHFDVILTPAAAALPWPAEQPYPTTIAGQAVGPRGHAVYSAWVNACGHPGISLPSVPSAAGLPIGIQLVTGFGEDELLLRLAAQYEHATAAALWGGCWPWSALALG